MNPLLEAPPAAKIRVMIVEDHVLVRMGLVTAANDAPDILVVAEIEEGAQVVDAYRSCRPDVVVLDLRMPDMDGTRVITALKEAFGQVRILMLSSYGGGDDIVRAMKAGASGYVVKGMPLSVLLEGIRAVHKGDKYLPDELSNRLKQQESSEISSRELDVLRLIIRGRSNKEIASDLGIVEGTVKAHLAHIFAKLGASDRAQAIAIAIKRQLLQLD